MSSLNITDVAANATIYGCESDIVPVIGGDLEFSIACISLTATDASEYVCPHYDDIVITEESDCDYLFETTTNTNEGFYCALKCELRSSLVARGLPSEEYATGTASTLSSSLVITLTVLFLLTIILKTNHYY